MQTNCEAEAITSIYSPSVLWLSSYTSRRCSPALWLGEEGGEEEEEVVVVVCGGEGGGTRAASYEGWLMWEERDGGGKTLATV